ncbi:30S ribosomal protein S20 [Ostreibacterium oceani]|uniref:Small ribosomal subunit protein bS20 n=1 Tax=Ostreibacterium oceani TaxID=2654998 RepID=A0A6N7EVI3_9GAMM|nr:30S ribosomal protein S20 [Ostreibacterium oceani]MPV86561.1 30S ribosomal protein S20 [Ostreibacterium oceani]
MANSPQARKRARQAEQHRTRNVAQRSYMRTTVKNVLKAVEAGDKAHAEKAFELAVPALDKASRKGLIHANKAARIKSRLVRQLKAL